MPGEDTRHFNFAAEIITILVKTSPVNQLDCTAASDPHVGEATDGRGINGRGEEERGGEWVTVGEKRGYRVLMVSDSLSMQIARITGNALALAAPNCHSNNKRKAPFEKRGKLNISLEFSWRPRDVVITQKPTHQHFARHVPLLQPGGGKQMYLICWEKGVFAGGGAGGEERQKRDEEVAEKSGV